MVNEEEKIGRKGKVSEKMLEKRRKRKK